MAIGGVVIQFRAEADQAKREVGQLSDKLRRVGDDGQDSSSKLGRLSTTMKVGLAAAATAAAAGLVGAGKAMVDCGIAAMEDAQAAGKLADVLGNIPGITQAMIDANAAWIDGMELATHISDDDLRQAMGRLATATGDVAEAQDLVALAADVATGRNISLQKATKLVEDAHNGNTKALERQMPWLDANRDGTITYAEAVKGLGDKYKGAAEKAANRDPWEKLKVIWGQLRESLGQFLLPILDELAAWFASKSNRDKLQYYIGQVADLSEQFGKWLVQAIKDVYKWASSAEGKKTIKDLSNLLGDLADVTKSVLGWFDKIDGYSWAFNTSGLASLASILREIETAAKNAKAAFDRLTGKGKSSGGGGGSWGSAPSPAPPPDPRTRSARAGNDPGATTSQPVSVLVTEEQIYRAVARLLLAGDARNGRRVLVA
jgi:hypothetical protein